MTIPTTPREAVARIIDPEAFRKPISDGHEIILGERTAKAAVKADQIIALLNPQEGAEAEDIPHEASGNVFTNEIGQRVSLWMHNLPSGQIALEITRGSSIPEGFVLSKAEAVALASVAARHSPIPAHAGLVEAAERYRVAKAAHHEAFMSYAFGTDRSHLNALDDEECEAGTALLKVALSATLSEGGG